MTLFRQLEKFREQCLTQINVQDILRVCFISFVMYLLDCGIEKSFSIKRFQELPFRVIRSIKIVVFALCHAL